MRWIAAAFLVTVLGERRETMRSRAFGLLAVVAVAAIGCATAHNTPAQDLSWERWKVCDHFTTVSLDRVDGDGRLVVKGQQYEAAPFTTCVREVAAEQVRRGATAESQVALLVKIYGCLGGAM
jgi:hypothetical protein